VTDDGVRADVDDFVATVRLNAHGLLEKLVEIGLAPSTNSFVSGSASSDKFTLLSATPNLLTFGLPSPVPTGQTVTFDFKVNIPDTGPFQFDLSQTPVVPEPASALLAVVGMGLLCGICRHKAAKRRVDS
jgi:hypothetical protein